MAKADTKKKQEATGDCKDKEAATNLAIVALDKKFGKGTIIKGETTTFPEIGRIPSGSISLDRALNGGYARGRMIELFGPLSSGKTTITLHAIAECQKMGGICAFLDVEHGLDIFYAEALGVDINSLLLSQPDNGEQALNIVDTLVRSGRLDLIIVDSVAALVPQKELEGEIGDHNVGGQARLMSQAMRMLVGPTSISDTCVIFTNQIRMKIGIQFGSPEVVSGGNALKFYASQRLDIRRIATLSEGDDKTGIRSRIKIVKNKVGPPFRIAEINIMFGKGIDWAMDLLNLAVSMGIVDKAGAWYSYKEERLGQGTANAAKTLANNEEIREEIKDRIMNPSIVIVDE